MLSQHEAVAHQLESMTSRLDHEVASREAVEERYRRLHHKFTALSTGSPHSLAMLWLHSNLSFQSLAILRSCMSALEKADVRLVCAETSSLLTDLDDGDRVRGRRRR
eukprot:COSAG04_NODE_15605_length_526_cov_1.882904_1_plen_106_part_10